MAKATEGSSSNAPMYLVRPLSVRHVGNTLPAMKCCAETE
jgi:hypothetical protein